MSAGRSQVVQGGISICEHPFHASARRKQYKKLVDTQPFRYVTCEVNDLPAEGLLAEMSGSTTIASQLQNSTTISPEHLANEDRLRLVIYIIDGYLTLLLVLIGSLFNVILLICQTVYLCNCLLIYCLPTLLYGDTQIKGFYSYVILISHAFSGPSYIASTWIVLALTIERYFALSKPLAYRAFATASLPAEGLLAEMSGSTTIASQLQNSTTISPEHLANEDRLRLVIYIIDGYLTLLLVLIGSLFNVILLICQTVYLCNCLLIYCLPTLLYGDTQIKGFYSYVILISHAFSGPSYIASTWIVLALTIERYFALSKPLAYRAFATASRVRRILIGLLVAAFIFSFPRLFEYKPETKCAPVSLAMVDNSTNCYLTLVSTQLLQNETYWSVYHVWLIQIFVTIVPSMFILVLTLRISCSLHQAMQKRESLRAEKREPNASNNNSMKGEREPNVMLIMVILKFALSDPLPMAESALGAVAPEDSPAAAALIVSAANFLVALCSSINFLMFFASGRHFRRGFRRILCGENTVVNSPSSSTSDEARARRQASKTSHNRSVKSTTVTTLSDNDFGTKQANDQSRCS
ncbi:FMRFamide receptor [Toxocara canis]|uniref:FMRFamide receptor n=1 Tax=Toxocara canis TaxID=6265 RepID=A0A0B2VZV3_TOXCA|nr:FMRFamide receptor [Toxocara canis]